TAGLARMNMILHDFPTANILQGNTLSTPKFKDGEQLRTYDYVVANPPFSVKSWSVGLTPANDPYQRFAWGEPPAKQGDYAFLLHIIRSLKSTGKGACILPHGVLFRGNAEAVIREQLVRSGYLKAIIGLPANLFFGTGIPACILVLDKENASARKGIFMIDAAKGFIKDGPKNRLRDQDVRKIVDTFIRMADVPRYARMVSFDEISDPKNGFNLNLPRYIDSTEPEDIQDIDGHLRGGIPERDIDAFDSYWQVMPDLRAALFKPASHSGYFELVSREVKPVIFGHPQFSAFKAGVDRLFSHWLTRSTPQLKGFATNSHPKELIAALSEDLLSAFAEAHLLDHYDIYQHLMDYWAETMQDDCYLISADGWKAAAKAREILKVKDKNNKLGWAEKHDYCQGKRRFKSDLIPVDILISHYFMVERSAIEGLETQLSSVEQSMSEMLEEHSGEDGSLSEVIEGERDKQKVTAKAIKARQREIGMDPDYEDEFRILTEYDALISQQSSLKDAIKRAEEDLDDKVHAKYPLLTDAEIKTLVVDDKWVATLAAAVQGELDRVSLTLTARIRELSERYAVTLPQLTDEVATLASRVEEHLKKMGAVW
ncbi:type I restriction endonuclease subunit M, partial [Pseudomonas sp. HMWF031]